MTSDRQRWVGGRCHWKQEKIDRGLETRRREKQINDKGAVSEKKIKNRTVSKKIQPRRRVCVCDLSTRRGANFKSKSQVRNSENKKNACAERDVLL